jgi:RimJ/RimL family protein N-acetyltransferase
LSTDPLPLLTARTRLRRLSEADLPRFQAYRNDAETGRWQGWHPMDDAAAQAFLQDVATSPFCTPGQWFQLGIAERDSDALIGDIGVQLHGGAGLMAELGFTLAPAAQGRGLATEAVGAMVGWLLAHSPAQRVVAVADTRNLASLRLLQRLGLRPFATLPAVFRGQACLEQHWVARRERRIALRLRPARAADADAVHTVLRLSRQVLMPFAPSVHSDADSAQWVARHLIPGGGVTVAEHAGQVVGVLAVSRQADAHWIDQLYVHPAQCAAGVGGSLLRHVLQRLARLPRPVRLHTFQANLHARAFYERHGFKAVAFSDGQGNEERCPDVLYERPLPSAP